MTLLILAAGLGTRFKGGIKQLTPIGPKGELIIEYSIYDAIKAGCSKVVFIIRKDIEASFRELIGNKLEKYVKVEYCFQDIKKLPDNIRCDTERTKPWGTVHAVLAAAESINEPFVIINADDYYGKNTYSSLFDFLASNKSENELCMGGFILKNTLSSSGTVTRGICETDANGKLLSVTETYKLYKNTNGEIVGERNGIPYTADADSIVSMNMWGCTPNVLKAFEKHFLNFLSESIKHGTIASAEYALPMAIDNMIKQDNFSVNVIPTNDTWLGITQTEDCEYVRQCFNDMIQSGEYPSPLFE